MQSVGNMLFIQVDIVASSQQIFPSPLRRITSMKSSLGKLQKWSDHSNLVMNRNVNNTFYGKC